MGAGNGATAVLEVGMTGKTTNLAAIRNQNVVPGGKNMCGVLIKTIGSRSARTAAKINPAKIA